MAETYFRLVFATFGVSLMSPAEWPGNTVLPNSPSVHRILLSLHFFQEYNYRLVKTQQVNDFIAFSRDDSKFFIF